MTLPAHIPDTRDQDAAELAEARRLSLLAALEEDAYGDALREAEMWEREALRRALREAGR